jgi:predicted transcriptional regulator
MKENIRITDEGKIEIIKMKKVFSVLTTVPNNEDIFDCKDLSKGHEIGTQ